LHQAVSTITSFKQQLKQQNKRPKTHSKQSEEGEITSNNKTDQDPCTISNNETASLIKQPQLVMLPYRHFKQL